MLVNRRAAIAGTSIAGLMASGAKAAPAPRLIKPRLLRPGDKVAVIDPSTALYDPAALPRAKAVIEALGLTPVFAENWIGRPRDLKGSIAARLSDLHGAFEDPAIRGVFCARGGYGVSEIVDRIDYGLVRANPKVFLGFSDITLLQLAMLKTSGLVTFHGRMPALTRFPLYSLEALRRAACSPEPLGLVSNPPDADTLRPANPLRTIAGGRAAGTLVGGNLSMIMAAMGTPWEIDTRGAVLFIEDVGEAPYAMARMLHQLRHAGKLGAAAAVVVGRCVNCDEMSDASPYGLNEVFDQTLGALGIPVFSGLLLGHTDEQLTVPIGVRAEVDADACQLRITEAGVTP